MWCRASRDPPATLRGSGEAGAQVAVEIEVLGVICPTLCLGEFCPRRAGVVVVLGVVDEVLPGEEAALGPARRQRLGHDRRDAGAFARQNLITAENSRDRPRR